MPQSRWTEARRREAWAHGRSMRDSLLRQYEREYGIPAPPPATIGPELVTDMLGYGMAYLPLARTVYGETTWEDGRPHITMNTRTAEIPGVKDAEGVISVGIWHEIIHTDRDIAEVRVGLQGVFDGMLPNLTIACRRDQPTSRRSREEASREFFAEEAGRAAAVSYVHLARVEAFRQFFYRSQRRMASNAEGWQLLYEAARAIGVNISALVRQLELEGYLTIERSAQRSVLHVQPGMGDLLTRTVH